MEFEIEDIILFQDRIYFVTGVIHDSERLFITAPGNLTEIEILFSQVEQQWCKKIKSHNSG